VSWTGVGENPLESHPCPDSDVDQNDFFLHFVYSPGVYLAGWSTGSIDEVVFRDRVSRLSVQDIVQPRMRSAFVAQALEESKGSVIRQRRRYRPR